MEQLTTQSSGDLAGRHVVITGARGGLGPAVVDAFAAAGAICHLPTREAGAVAARSGVHVAGGIDLANEESVRAFFASVPPLWASIQIAGGFSGAPFLQMSLADLRLELDRNLVTAFLCCREAARRMGAGGGRLVNVSSRAALVPAGGAIAYSIAKAGVSHLTRCLADELAPAGILVNAVAPATIDTARNRADMPRADHARWTPPADIARAILWLASPQNTVTSGEVLPVYGKS